MKIAHRPLLAAGFHEITPAQIAKIFLDPMPLSQRRPALVAGLLHFLNDLAATKVKCEVWIDGSFVTDKLEPNERGPGCCVGPFVADKTPYRRFGKTRSPARQAARHEAISVRCVQRRNHRYRHDGILERIVRFHARRQNAERDRSDFDMKSEELDRLEKRIELVKTLLKEREGKPQDFATSMTVRSLRYHLQDIEQQRANLKAELSDASSDREMRT